jgi:hypothetical protein
MESFKEFKDFALKLKLEDPSTDRLRIHLDADGFLVKLNPFTSEIKLVRQDFEKKLNTQFEILRPLISSMQAPD